MIGSPQPQPEVPDKKVPDLLHVCVRAIFTERLTGWRARGNVALCGAKDVQAIRRETAKQLTKEERATLCRSCVARLS